MKRFISGLFVSAVAICLLASCSWKEPFDCGAIDEVDAEVEIRVSSAASGGTRAALDGNYGLEADNGVSHESEITTLDLLAFDHATGRFLYRRVATEITTGNNRFRVQMKKIEGTTFDIYLFANCRGVIDRWEGSPGDKTALNWEDVRGALQFNEAEAKALVDPEAALGDVDRTWNGLPMFNEELKNVDIDPDKTPTLWPNGGEALLLRRAVASIDLYVQQNSGTRRFDLKGMFAWYAPNTGFPAAAVDDEADDYRVNSVSVPLYLVPSNMTASLTATEGVRNAEGTAWSTAPVLHAYRVRSVGASDGYTYQAIDYQIYLYENRYLDKALEAAGKRPTRIIMSGRYWTDDETTPDRNNPAGWQDAYYAIDMLESGSNGQSTYRPLIRNWKYELRVVGVTGPGYGNIEDAAVNEPIDLGLDVIPWNKDDVQVGVKGHYYVTMEEREALLWRDASHSKSLDLFYEIKDGGNATFTLDFKTGDGQQDNGAQASLTEGTGIQNTYFEVEMVQTHDTGNNKGSVIFTITALKPYTEGHNKNIVVVKFRELIFEIEIEQVDGSQEDWRDGGGILKDI
jgi:hypothetical protein